MKATHQLMVESICGWINLRFLGWSPRFDSSLLGLVLGWIGPKLDRF